MVRRILFAKRDFETFAAEVKASPGAETGRVLVGAYAADDIVVAATIPAGPRARRTAVRFSPDSDWQQGLLDVLHQRFNVNYVGDVHSHPAEITTPSHRDWCTARHIVTDPEWRTPLAAFPIAVVRDGEVEMRGFLMRREVLEFESLDVVVVENDHPLMLEVLSGTDAEQKERVDASQGHPHRQPRGDRARRLLRRAAAYLRHLSTR